MERSLLPTAATAVKTNRSITLHQGKSGKTGNCHDTGAPEKHDARGVVVYQRVVLLSPALAPAVHRWTMSMRSRSVSICLFFWLFAGCGQEATTPAPVHGRVFFKGVPLSHGSIVFTPDAERGGSGPLARGDIGPDGRYVLTTDGQTGAAPGWHRVTIVATDGPADRAQGTEFVDVHSLLPRKYAAPDLSGLEALVKTGEDNVLDFHLQPDP
jgi:hypothetical protein